MLINNGQTQNTRSCSIVRKAAMVKLIILCLPVSSLAATWQIPLDAKSFETVIDSLVFSSEIPQQPEAFTHDSGMDIVKEKFTHSLDDLFNYTNSSAVNRGLLNRIMPVTVLRAVQSIPGYHPNKNFSSWCCKIGKNRCTSSVHVEIVNVVFIAISVS